MGNENPKASFNQKLHDGPFWTQKSLWQSFCWSQKSWCLVSRSLWKLWCWRRRSSSPLEWMLQNDSPRLWNATRLWAFLKHFEYQSQIGCCHGFSDSLSFLWGLLFWFRSNFSKWLKFWGLLEWISGWLVRILVDVYSRAHKLKWSFWSVRANELRTFENHEGPRSLCKYP